MHRLHGFCSEHWGTVVNSGDIGHLGDCKRRIAYTNYLWWETPLCGCVLHRTQLVPQCAAMQQLPHCDIWTFSVDKGCLCHVLSGMSTLQCAHTTQHMTQCIASEWSCWALTIQGSQPTCLLVLHDMKLTA